jgi:hypothetical protein
MGVFYKRVVLFLLFPLASASILFVFLYRFNSQLLDRFRVDKSVSTLIVGDSRTEFALNDQLLPNTMNISQTSEGYIYSFPILAGILKNNPQIKTVLLGFSFQSISSYYDNSSLVPHISARYFYILPRNIQMEILKRNQGNLSLEFRKIFTNGFRNLIARPNKYTFIGKYETFSTSKSLTKSSVDKRIAAQYYENGKLAPFADVNTNYFLKIVDLCKRSNIKLVILNTPMHKSYVDGVPQAYKDKYYSLIKENNLDLIEFENLVLKDTCFLPDGDHLSRSGTTPATLYLKDVLSRSPDLNFMRN